MPFIRPTLSTLRAQAIADITSALPIGGALLPKSNLGVLAAATSGQAYDLYALVDFYAINATPFTAVDEYLEAWANLKGIYRIDAQPSSGTVSVANAIGGTDIPAGTGFSRADGAKFTSNADYVTGSSGTLTLTATVAGSAGNCPLGTSFSLSSPITGINGAIVATAAFTGGTDQELDPALRTRMLLAYSASPQGGSALDFTNWALQVPGVTRAWCNPVSLGLITVAVFVMFDISESAYQGFPQGTNGGATLETRTVAATGDQLSVANYIFPLRPVTAEVVVMAPAQQPVNFAIQGLSPNTTPIQAGIAAALAELLVDEGTPLGGFIYPSDINAAIEGVTGVGHFSLLSPSAPVATAYGSLPVVGNIAYS